MAGPPSDDNIQVDNFDRGRAGMRNILAENERLNNSRGSGISVTASSSGPRYSRTGSQSRYNVDLRQGRRISHPDNSPSRRQQSWSYQISGDSLQDFARERLNAGNTTGNSTDNTTGDTADSNNSATTNSPLASISNSASGGRTVHHSIHVPERSFPGSGQSISNSQFPGQGNSLSDDPGTLKSVPEVSNLESTASATPDSNGNDDEEVGEKAEKTEKKMSYDMQTQATELCNMSTQTDLPPITSQQPKSFSQSALRSGNLDAVRAQRLKALEKKS